MPRDIEPKSWKIDRIITQIEEGQIKIPPLQRPFVWKIDQIIRLLESIYNDYPIGSILLWETNIDLPAARNIAGFDIPERAPEYPVYYVLDGQQRLSSLYGVFAKDRRLETGQIDYAVNSEIFDILFDFEDKIFIHISDRKTSGRYFEMKNLLDVVKFHEYIATLSDEDKKEAVRLLASFSNYEIPLIITRKRSKEEVGIIFERINNSGTSLDLFDLMVAWTWIDDFHLLKKYSALIEILANKNFDGIQKKTILQCLSGIIKKSTKSREIVKINPEELRNNYDLFEKSLKKTIDYLNTELSVKSINLLPHTHQIVPLCYLFSKINTPNQEQKKVINEWFWKTSFSKRYSSSTDTHLDEDIQAFDNMVSSSDYNVFSNLGYSVTEDQLKRTKFIQSNSYSRAFVVLLASRKPLNLVNGGYVDTGEALSTFNKKEYHHVFPRAYLSGRGVDSNEINSLCNFCILPADANKLISDKAPSEYFQTIIPQQKYKEILDSNLLPIISDIYSKNDFSQFIDHRARNIMEYLNSCIL